MFTLTDKRKKTKQATLVVYVPIDMKRSLDRVTKTYRQANRQVVIRKMLTHCLEDTKEWCNEASVHEESKILEKQGDTMNETGVSPTVGRIVHYMAHGSKDGTYPSIPRAAIIAETTEDPATVKLAVLNPQGIHFNTSKFSNNGEPGTWNWPPRV